MDNAIETRRSEQAPLESQLPEISGSQMAETLDENNLLDNCGFQHQQDSVFEEERSDDRQSEEGPDFDYGGVEVIWLANNDLDGASTADRESDLFNPTIEVGANETAVAIGRAAYLADTSSQRHATLDSAAVSDQTEPFPSNSQYDTDTPHAVSSEVNPFLEISDVNFKQAQYVKPCGLWAQKVGETNANVSSGTVFGTSQSTNTYVADPPSSNDQLNSVSLPSTGDVGKLDLHRNPVTEYMPPQNSRHFPISSFHPDGIMTTNLNSSVQQQHQDCEKASNTYLTYTFMPNNPISRNSFPVYMNEESPFSQQLNATYNLDMNSNVFPHSTIQHRRPAECITQSYSPLPAPSPSAIGRETVVQISCPECMPLQQPVCAYPSSVNQLPSSSFINQQPLDIALHHQSTSTSITNKTVVNNNNVAVLMQQKPLYSSASEKSHQNLRTPGFQMPFIPTHSQVDTMSQRDCSPPLLVPSTFSNQEDDIGAFVPLSPQISSTQCPSSTSQECCVEPLPPVISPSVKSFEDVSVFRTPRKLGEALSRHAYYSRGTSPIVDVLVRNSVRNFEMTTTLSSKVPLNSSHPQPRFLSDTIPRKDKVPRTQCVFSSTRYPNMVDVNFRRRSGTRTFSRPRHLCDQTREVVGRVCAYFREFSKRFAALGNNIAGTPFENPDRMASHATGFTIPTIRRCGECMEALPLCTYRTGSVPTDEEISNLSAIFSEEPWLFGSKGRARPVNIRRKTRKRSTPSVISLSEAEESVDEQQIVDDSLELEELEENTNGVPKRRRSQRIRNQRRAKLLNRLRAKNNEPKNASMLRNANNKKDDVNKEGSTLESVNVPNLVEQQSSNAMVTQLPKQPELERRRSRASFLKLYHSDAESDKDVRSAPTAKRSRSAVRLSIATSTDEIESGLVVQISSRTEDKTSAMLVEDTTRALDVDLGVMPKDNESVQVTDTT